MKCTIATACAETPTRLKKTKAIPWKTQYITPKIPRFTLCSQCPLCLRFCSWQDEISEPPAYVTIKSARNHPLAETRIEKHEAHIHPPRSHRHRWHPTKSSIQNLPRRPRSPPPRPRRRHRNRPRHRPPPRLRPTHRPPTRLRSLANQLQRRRNPLPSRRNLPSRPNAPRTLP